jgi:hypothetical protein
VKEEAARTVGQRDNVEEEEEEEEDTRQAIVFVVTVKFPRRWQVRHCVVPPLQGAVHSHWQQGMGRLVQQ